MLVNSSIRDLDSKGMSLSGKASVTRPREGGRHAVSKFRRAVRVKITIGDRKRGTWRRNLRGKRLSVRKGELMRRRALDSTLSRKAVCLEHPHKCYAYSIRGRIRPLYMDINSVGQRNWRRRYRTPNFQEAESLREM